MSEELTGCDIPGPGRTRPSLSPPRGRADGPPGSGRRLARGTGVGPTGRQDRADGSPGGQGIGPTGRLGGQGPARGQGVGRRTARGTGTESPAGSRTAAGPGQTGSRRTGQRVGPDRPAPQGAIRVEDGTAA